MSRACHRETLCCSLEAAVNRGSVSSWQPPEARPAGERVGAPAPEEVGLPPPASACSRGVGEREALQVVCFCL